VQFMTNIVSARVNPSSEQFFSELSLLLLDAGDQCVWKYSLVQQGGLFRVEPRVDGKIACLKRCMYNWCGTSYDLKKHTIQILDLADKKLQIGKKILEEGGESTPEFMAELTSAVFVLQTLPGNKDVALRKCRKEKEQACSLLVSQLRHLQLKKIAKDNHLSLDSIEAREKTIERIWALHSEIDMLRFSEKLSKSQSAGIKSIKETRIREYKRLLTQISNTKWKKSIAYSLSRFLPKNQISLSYEAKMHTLFADTIPRVSVCISQPQNVMDLCEQLLDKHQGVCIGERHDEIISEYLCLNMKKLKEMGVRTLFTEQFLYTQQHCIDAYLATGDVQHAKNAMRRPSADKPWQLFEYHHRLLETARKEGIRVVGIDTRTTMQNEAMRLVEMNYLASRVIEQEKHSGKFIALVGAYHLTTFDRGAIPGLSELTRTPAIKLNHTEMSKATGDVDRPYERADAHAVATLYKGVVLSRREMLDQASDFASKIIGIKEENEGLFDLGFSRYDFMAQKLHVTLQKSREVIELSKK
jgi:hypothetical protein